MLEAALSYAELGWHVVACLPRSKAPLTSKLPHAVKDSTVDPSVLREWFTSCPDANVGIRCGSISGIVVLDVDPKNGGDATLARMLSDHGPLPDSITVATGSGGMHVYFQHPGYEIDNWQDGGVELRVENLYVLAPPSMHPCGDPYRWLVGPADGVGLARLPEWTIRHKRRPDLKLVVPNQSAAEKWAATALDSELSELASCPAGNRNNKLNEAAFALGQIIGSGYLPRYLVENRLLDAAHRNGSLEEDGEPKVRSTIRSGIEAGLKEPRGPKDNGFTPARPTATATVPETSGIEYLDLSVEPPPVEWIVPDWLAVRDIGMAASSPFTGKSTLLGDLAVAITHDRAWCTDMKVLRTGPVLYFDEEQSKGTVQRLFRSLGGENGRGLHVASCQGVRITTPEGREQLEREINRLEPTLVVLDTVVQVMAGTDLSSMEEVAEAFRYLFAMRNRYPTAFLLAHHHRKMPSGNTSGMDPAERMFGSVGFKGNVDTAWDLDKDGGAVRLSQRKRRDGDKGLLSIMVRYTKQAGIITLACEGPPVEAEGEKDRAEVAIVRALAANYRLMKRDIVKACPEASASTIKRALEHLKAIGKITSPSHGCYMLSEGSASAISDSMTF